MSPKEKQATPKVAFVFLGPLTKVPPAQADICFLQAINERIACVSRQ